MMRNARYARKRHMSYLQAHMDAIILFLLKNKRNRLTITQIVNKNKAATSYCWQSASLFYALLWFISVKTLKLSVSVADILKCFTQLLNKPFISIRLSGLCNKPLYAINQTIFLTNGWLWFGIYNLYAIIRNAINRIRLYSLLKAEDNGLLWAKEEDEVLNELKTDRKERVIVAEG